MLLATASKLQMLGGGETIEADFAFASIVMLKLVGYSPC